MNGSERFPLLFQFASECRFADFDALFAELEEGFSEQESQDAYGMRAQIKIFAADDTALSDLQKACRGETVPRYPCLRGRWPADSPNRFVVFSRAPGALQRFMKGLPQASEHLLRLYGAAGCGMAQQIRSEILYFMSAFTEALELAKEQLQSNQGNCLYALQAQYVMLRANLALGLAQDAEQCMLDMIRKAKTSPGCLAAYQVVRGWANLTTGWSGDTPRYAEATSGAAAPVLEDRLEAIREGISRLSPAEEPFAEYAHRHYEGAYTVRQYFMDAFTALYWMQHKELQQTEAFFLQAYHIAINSGLCMPFVEYGKQMLPLLHYFRGHGDGVAPGWIDSVIPLAEQYEANIDTYRT